VKNSEWIIEWEIEWWESCYFMLLQCIRKMLRSLITDLIRPEVNCGECLWELLRDRLSKDMICMIMMERSLIEKNEKGSQVMCGKTGFDNTEGWYKWRWCWIYPFSDVQFISMSWNHYWISLKSINVFLELHIIWCSYGICVFVQWPSVESMLAQWVIV
jgi:hypothetical protein